MKIKDNDFEGKKFQRTYSPQEASKSQQQVEENLPEAPENENNADVNSPLILESCP